MLSVYAQGIQEKIKKAAESIGYKAANAAEINELCEEISALLHFKVKTPDGLSLHHVTISDHLTKYAPLWKTLWEEFKAKQRTEIDALNEGALQVLDKLRSLILETFEKYPIPDDLLVPYLGTLEPYLEELKKLDPKAILMLMIRSTGKKEDRVDMANPGGNESVPSAADVQAISHGIAIMVASLFSEKSFQQQLITQEGETKNIESILEDPFMPVLIQRMIGEPLFGHKNSKRVVKSGVMYTSTAGTRIQLAPGHGESVVNSEAPFDTFFVTRENVVHAEINYKPSRLVPSQTEGNIKTTLIFQTNPKELEEQPSISNHAALKIAEVGRLIEKHYGMPMDVEFVYEPNPEDAKQDTLYLVQARPFPKGDLKLVVPSSLAPEKVIELKQNKEIEIKKSAVITPAGCAARVINNPNQLLIFNNIRNALDFYLHQKSSPVKAVIVRDMAPATSHEAALFNSKAIPVVYLSDTTAVETWMKFEKPVVIIDPQRRQIMNVSSLIKNHSESEKELYDEKILKVGIFKSPLPAQETLISLFPKVQNEVINKLEKEPITLTDTSLRIGDLIEKSNSMDIKESEVALNKLMALLFLELPQKPSSPLELNKFYKTLLENIETLEGAQFNVENHKSLKALQAILLDFYRIGHSKEGFKEGSTHRKLFQQAMVTGMEIHHSLDNLSQLDPSASEAAKNQAQMEFLDLVSKLEALITNPGNENLFSDSILQIAQQNVILKEAEKIKGFKTLDEEQKSYFVELLKLQKLALNQRFSKKWVSFAYQCCKNKSNLQLLAKLIQFTKANKIESDWLNTSFFKALLKEQSLIKKEVMKKEASTILKSLAEEAIKIKKELEDAKLTEKRIILKTWEHRISEWADPKKFDKLWKDCEKELLLLISELNIENDQQPLTQKAILKMVQDLTEIMDRTIKAMKGSPEYQENDHQVERFVQLLTPYHELMRKWVKKIPESQFKKWAKHVNERPEYNRDPSLILLEINKVFENLKTKRDLTQLNPSGEISIAACTPGSSASFARQFVDKGEYLTLEDLFSLMHQIILMSISFLSKKTQIAIEILPEAIQSLTKSILAVKYYNFGSYFKPRLLVTDHQYPVFQIEYNLALRNHSAKFTLTYNQKTQKTTFYAKFFGHNGGRRMDAIATVAIFDANILGISLQQEPQYDVLSQVLEFSFELDPGQTLKTSSCLKEMLETYTNITFGFKRGAERLNTFLSPRHENIQIEKAVEQLTSKQIEKALSAFPNFFDVYIKLLKNGVPVIAKEYVKTQVTMEVIYNTPSLSISIIEKLIKLFEYPIDFNHRLPGKKSLFETLIFLNTSPEENLYNFIEENNFDLSGQLDALSYALSKNYMGIFMLLIRKGAPISSEIYKNPQYNSFIVPHLKEKFKGYTVKKKKEILTGTLEKNPDLFLVLLQSGAKLSILDNLDLWLKLIRHKNQNTILTYFDDSAREKLKSLILVKLKLGHIKAISSLLTDESVFKSTITEIFINYLQQHSSENLDRLKTSIRDSKNPTFLDILQQSLKASDVTTSQSSFITFAFNHMNPDKKNEQEENVFKRPHNNLNNS